MENLTTGKRPLRSIVRPISEPSMIAETDRTSAYIDRGNSVAGNAEARNSTAPNSKEREFQVDMKWEM